MDKQRPRLRGRDRRVFWRTTGILLFLCILPPIGLIMACYDPPAGKRAVLCFLLMIALGVFIYGLRSYLRLYA